MIRKMFLGICCVLAAILFVFPAPAENSLNTRDDRLAEARLKYNKDTVNILLGSRNPINLKKINVRFYKSDRQPQMYIMIYESLKITDEAEMQAILEVVAQSEYYSEEIYGTVSMMKAEWIAHNIAYEMATGTAEERDLADIRLINSGKFFRYGFDRSVGFSERRGKELFSPHQNPFDQRLSAIRR